jgi:hypothetical protein
MIKTYIGGVDYSEFIDDGSIVINDQIQNKANTLSCSLFPGTYTLPSDNQEILMYDVFEVSDIDGFDVTIKDNSRTKVSVLTFGKIRVGEKLYDSFGVVSRDFFEVVSILDNEDGTITLTLDGEIDVSSTYVGKILFGGNITGANRVNPRTLDDVEVPISATDFTKTFDRKNVNNAWQDRDARYIMNDSLNTAINYNLPIDEMEYVDNAAAQAVYTESGDGQNVQSFASIIQGDYALKCPWLNSSGVATWTATALPQRDLSDLVGVTSGQPTKGLLTCWFQSEYSANITSLKLRVGSSSVNYIEVELPVVFSEDYYFVSLPLKDGTMTGTPVWTEVDSFIMVLVNTDDGEFIIDDVRIVADGSFSMFNFSPTSTLEDVRVPMRKPTILINDLAKYFQYSWFIDYTKDISFFASVDEISQIVISDESDNFRDLEVDIDSSQIKNSQVVSGGDDRSLNFYTQVVEGNNAVREWILKNKFADLSIFKDDNTSTDTMEASTTATTVNATAHGLVNGDYIINRTRANAVRQITYVNANQFTVESVTGQVSGDTFSKFATSRSVVPEFSGLEATFDYVSSYQEKAIRATDSEPTLQPGEFLLFKYKEIIPIRVLVRDNESIERMKALVGGDGVFDGALIEDSSLQSRTEARERARVEIRQYANPIYTITFKTNEEGLKAGQVISIQDTNKGISDNYLIQKVTSKYKTGDFPDMTVTCASSLFGIVEYFQKIARENQGGSINSDAQVDLIIQNSSFFNFEDNNEIKAPVIIEEDINTETDDTIYLNDTPTWVYGPYSKTSDSDRKTPLFLDRDNLLV